MLKNLLGLPILTHALLAVVYVIPLVLAYRYVPPDLLPFVAGAVTCSTFWYGREAGQNEHEVKPVRGWLSAWLGSEFFYGWDGAKRLQWFAPAVASALASLALYAYFVGL